MIRFALAGVWSELGELKLEHFSSDQPTLEYRKIVDAAVEGMKECRDWHVYQGLSNRMNLLDIGKTQGYAVFSGRIFRNNELFELNRNGQDTRISVAKIANDLGYYTAPIGAKHFRLILPPIFIRSVFEDLIRCFAKAIPERMSGQASDPSGWVKFEDLLADALGFSLCQATFEAARRMEEGRLRDALPDLKAVEGAGAQLGEIKLRWERTLNDPQEVIVTMTQIRRTIKGRRQPMSGAQSLNESLVRRQGNLSMSYADFGMVLAEQIPDVLGGEREGSAGFRLIRSGLLSQSPDVMLLAWDDSKVGLIGFQAKALEPSTPWPTKAYKTNQNDMRALGDALKSAFDKKGNRQVLTGAVFVGTHEMLPEDLEEMLEEQEPDGTLVWQDAWAVGGKENPSLLLNHLHAKFLL